MDFFSRCFLEKVRNLAIEQDWNNILRVKVPPTTPIAGQAAPVYNFVTEYGRMTMANANASARNYTFLLVAEPKCTELLSAFLAPPSLYG